MTTEVVKKILDETLAAAVTGVLRLPQTIPDWVEELTLEANFVQAGGGTTAKAWVQTSFDGVNWTDIANFAFTTTSVRQILTLKNVSITTPYTATDGTLADNTVKEGILGPWLQTKLTTTGTYTGASTFVINARFRKG